MHHFIRLNGALLEVCPLTKPHRERSVVIVQVVRDGRILTVEHRDIILDY
ncbi:hypothetical protein SEA_CANDC_101 [Microbacterium phage CandC]|nr:hypothetical protein SEA_CANDC_101 [Microbacterium phage CandC]